MDANLQNNGEGTVKSITGSQLHGYDILSTTVTATIASIGEHAEFSLNGRVFPWQPGIHIYANASFDCMYGFESGFVLGKTANEAGFWPSEDELPGITETRQALLQLITSNAKIEQFPIAFFTRSTNTPTIRYGKLTLHKALLVTDEGYEVNIFVSQCEDTTNEVEQSKRIDTLLRNVLPPSEAERVKIGKMGTQNYDDVIVLFSDIAEYTSWSQSFVDDSSYHRAMSTYYAQLCKACEQFGLTPVKFIGDSLMALGGFPEFTTESVLQATLFAFRHLEIVNEIGSMFTNPFSVRMGMHVGSIRAGTVGTLTRFSFDVTGRAAIYASRLESSCAQGCIHVSQTFYDQLVVTGGRDNFAIKETTVSLKGYQGVQKTYLIMDKIPASETA